MIVTRRFIAIVFPLGLLLAAAPLCAGRAHGQNPEFNQYRDPFVAALAAKDRDLQTVRETAEGVIALQSAKAVDLLVERGLLSNSPEVEQVIQEVLFKAKKGPALTQLIEHANKNEKVAVRVQLCYTLAMIKDLEAFKSLLTNLYDPSDSVIAAAAEGVELKNNFEAVRHLIDALQYQEEQQKAEGVSAHRIRKALTKLTALDFYASAAWRKFWDAYEKGFRRPTPSELEKLKREIAGISEGRTTVIDQKRPPPKTFFGVEVQSQRIVFVIDVSSSMHITDPPPPEPGPDSNSGGAGGDGGKDGGTEGTTEVTGQGKNGKGSSGDEPNAGKKEREKGGDGQDESATGDKPKYGSRERMRVVRMQREFCRLIEELPADTQFTAITFSSKVTTLSGSALLTATPEHKEQAKKFVCAFGPEGETWTDRALDKAFEVEGADTIVLLSDGSPVRNRKVIDCFKLMDELEFKNRFRRIQIYTVGFAGTAKEVGTFLREVARKNWGKYREIP